MTRNFALVASGVSILRSHDIRCETRRNRLRTTILAQRLEIFTANLCHRRVDFQMPSDPLTDTTWILMLQGTYTHAKDESDCAISSDKPGFLSSLSCLPCRMFDDQYSTCFTKETRQWRKTSTRLAKERKTCSRRNLGIVLPYYSTI